MRAAVLHAQQPPIPMIDVEGFESEEEERHSRRESPGGVDDALLPTPIPPVLTPVYPDSNTPGELYPVAGNNGGIPGTVAPRRVDVNVYAHKKTLAQGMMDLALLSANANQLRYVYETGPRHPYYYPSLVFIQISLVMQIAVGVGLIINSQYNIKKDADMKKANRINNFTMIGIFLVTILNVFISAFGVGVDRSVFVETIKP